MYTAVMAKGMGEIAQAYFLAFKHKLAYKESTNQVARSLIGLYHMPARTLNDFFAGFFYSQVEADSEVRIKKAGSVWAWHEEFAVDRSETF